jgi:L-fucose isomerase-like protein
MKQHVTLGVVCLARKTFDFNAAGELYKKIQKDLGVLENVSLEMITDLVIEVEDAQKAARQLAAKHIDGLVCISGTFHLGHLVLEMERVLRKPILLWGLPELPYDGGKIRLNSVCGVNLNASNLYKSGVRTFHATVGGTIDEDWLDAVRVLSAFSTAHVGIAGFRAHGFFNLGVRDLNVYSNFGVLIDHYELHDVYEYPVQPADVARRKDQLRSLYDVSGISVDQLDKVAMLSARMEKFLDDNRITALALRCWPEFAANFGVSPCAAMSLLQSEDRILACEGDVEGALSMLAHRAAGAGTPFLFDFSQVNFDEDFALLWHCGVAPCNLWDGSCVRSLDTYFAGGKGVTADFVLRTGDVSILRFDSAGDEYRMFLQKAHGIPMEKELRGTYLKVRFDEPVRAVMEKLVYNGIAHHASMAYGDFLRPFEILARIKGWRVIQ